LEPQKVSCSYFNLQWFSLSTLLCYLAGGFLLYFGYENREVLKQYVQSANVEGVLDSAKTLASKAQDKAMELSGKGATTKEYASLNE